MASPQLPSTRSQKCAGIFYAEQLHDRADTVPAHLGNSKGTRSNGRVHATMARPPTSLTTQRWIKNISTLVTKLPKRWAELCQGPGLLSTTILIDPRFSS